MALKEYTYDIGDTVRLACSFKQAGQFVDPDTVVVKVKNPSTGEVATRTFPGITPEDDELQKDSQGNYHLDVIATTNGRWWVRWEGSGSSQSAVERSFFVRTSNF